METCQEGYNPGHHSRMIQALMPVFRPALQVGAPLLSSRPMKAGIVGLPNVGKSTLFNALTEAGAEASNYPFCTIEPNVGIVQVPDERLHIINQFIATEKVIPAAMQLVDIAGLVRGASKGEGLGNKFLSHIREVDAVLHVVRCFDDPNVTHVDGGVDPIRDIETIETELLLADLEVAETSLARSKKMTRSGDKEALARVKILEQCFESLSAGKPVRAVAFEDPDDQKLVRGLGFLSSKKVLYVANVNEDSVEGDNAHVKAVQDHAAAKGGEVVRVCAKIESELVELPVGERAEMLRSLGMKEPALNAVARAAYRLLGLQSFFTAGPKEIRAWTISVGCKAPQAAGVIHSDFERGFIRVEVYSVNDLSQLKSESAIKSAGKMRLEGKEYTMRESDVCHFLFNV